MIESNGNGKGAHVNGNGAHVNGNGHESNLMRGVRYMREITGDRDALRTYVRSFRDTNDTPRSLVSCDTVIDGAIAHLANGTIQTETDFSSHEDLVAAIRRSINDHFKDKPDRGWCLGE